MTALASARARRPRRGTAACPQQQAASAPPAVSFGKADYLSRLAEIEGRVRGLRNMVRWRSTIRQVIRLQDLG